MNMSETKTALALNSSIRGKSSNSQLLVNYLLDQLNFEHGHLIVNTRDISKSLPLIDVKWNEANFCRPEHRTSDQQNILTLSDVLIAELESADMVIIGAPMYNFSIPAGLKAWIDLIVRAGITFKYTESGPTGLAKNKPVYIVITTGGTELGSQLDFASGYLKHIFNFIGITNLNFINGAKYDINNSEVTIKTHAKIREMFNRSKSIPNVIESSKIKDQCRF